MRGLLAIWLILTAAVFGAQQSFSQGPSMLLLGAGKMSASAPPSTTTLNPSDKDGNLTLSNGDLTATLGTSAYANVRSVASASTGKKYWEYTATTIGGSIGAIVQGVANGSAALNNFFGNDNNSVGWAGDGTVYRNGGGVATIQSWAQGDTLCFSYDIDGGLIWFRTNGGNWNNNVAANPALGLLGIDISALAAGPYFAALEGHTNGDVLTANFGGSAYAQTAPSGFGNWARMTERDMAALIGEAANDNFIMQLASGI